jgi:hypothetical protein
MKLRTGSQYAEASIKRVHTQRQVAAMQPVYCVYKHLY